MQQSAYDPEQSAHDPEAAGRSSRPVIDSVRVRPCSDQVLFSETAVIAASGFADGSIGVATTA
jgi:hypothetical protein